MRSVPAAVLPAARRLSDGPGNRSTRPPGSWEPLKNSGRLPASTLKTLKTNAAKIQQRLAERKGIIDRAQTDLKGALAAIQSIRSLGTEFNDLDSLRAEALKMAREKGVAEKIDALYNNALSAVKTGDPEAAKTARQALQYTRDMLGQEYTLQIVSRPGSPRGSGGIPSTAARAERLPDR